MVATARITGGELAGRVVHATGALPQGFRPTSGRLREALFNILGPSVEDARVLDLFAGCGLIGFEALSRGASIATFVESSRSLAEMITKTAREFGIGDRVTVVHSSLPGALRKLRGRFDLVYIDPPYALPDVESTLATLFPLLAPGGRVVYEHSSRYNPPQRPPGLELEQRRIYGDSAIALYCGSESE